MSEDENGVKAKERVVRKVESIFKKPHRAAGKLTLSERKWEEKNVVEQNELFNKDQQVEGEGPLEVPEKEKKRVRLTIWVKPGERQEKKKKVMKGVAESSNEEEGAQQVSHLRRNVVEIDEGELDLHWDPGAFEMEHVSMQVAPRWHPTEGWFKKDVVQPMAALAEFTPYLASVTSVAVMGPFEQRGGEFADPVRDPPPTPTVVVFADGGGR